MAQPISQPAAPSRTLTLLSSAVHVALGVLILAVVQNILDLLPVLRSVVIGSKSFAPIILLQTIIRAGMFVLVFMFARDIEDRLRRRYPSLPQFPAMVRSFLTFLVIAWGYAILSPLLAIVLGPSQSVLQLFVALGAGTALVIFLLQFFRVLPEITDALISALSKAANLGVRCPECGHLRQTGDEACPRCSAQQSP